MSSVTPNPDPRAPRRPRVALALLMLAVGVVAGVAGTAWLLRPASATKQAAAVLYTCPMHPTVTSDHPGDCPICGMKLVAVPAAGGSAPVEAAAEAPSYQCPMHPAIMSDHPGDCPICGMKLVPVPASGAPGATAERKVLFYRSPMNAGQTSPVPAKDEMGMDYLPVYADETADGGPAAEGMSVVQIDPARQQLIGLRTARVTSGPVGGTWRTVGRVAIDETRVRHVNVKVDGYVERIYVDFVGKPVRRGEPLFSFYSPDVLSLQEEYLLAVRTKASLAGTPMAENGDALVESARRRLALWDVPSSVVDHLDATGEPQKTIVLVSPISGVVTEKSVVQGHKLSAGDMPYEITDLSEVWVLADIYEMDLARTEVGMPASFTTQGIQNHVFEGRVAFVDPILDPETRTAKVRMAFKNPEGRLLPEMFGDVLLHSDSRTGLRVPADAVIDSGTRKVVFVSLGDGKFTPREIATGATSGDQVEVVSGLQEGEEVVVRANFLIDSESRLKASLTAVSGK